MLLYSSTKGKITKRFLADENGTVESFEFDWLKPGCGTNSTILKEPQEHLRKKIGSYKIYDVIAGRCSCCTAKATNRDLIRIHCYIDTFYPQKKLTEYHCMARSLYVT